MAAQHQRDALVAPVLLVADPAFLPPSQRVWGTGSWLDPDSREALDWLGLLRGLGWDVEVVAPAAGAIMAALRPGRRWIVIGCDAAALDTDTVAALQAFVAVHPALVIARAAQPDAPWSRAAGAWHAGEQSTGHALAWVADSAQDWQCRAPFPAVALGLTAATRVLARLDGKPLVVAAPGHRGALLSLGFHPSLARDANGCATALVRKLLVQSYPQPVVHFDFSSSLVLRMDDPGTAQNVHLRSWSYPQLSPAEWDVIGELLSARGGCLSVAYVGGWVDDGDAARGSLQVAGRPVARVGGQVHPSAEVVYRDLAGHRPGTLHDYAGQYAALRRAQAAGRVDIELHGHTHMHPDRQGWAAADDRYDAVHWYRELGDACQDATLRLGAASHPLRVGQRELQRRFDVEPSTLVCPGDDWSQPALEVALDCGLQALSSYYYAYRFDQRFCWTQHVCAPYLNEPDAAWFEAGLPVVGYFHDAELALDGVHWLAQWLDRWQAAGATRLVSLRELCAAHTSSLDVIDAGSLGGPDGTWHIQALAASATCEGLVLSVQFHLPPSTPCNAIVVNGHAVPVPDADGGVRRLSVRLAAGPADEGAV